MAEEEKSFVIKDRRRFASEENKPEQRSEKVKESEAGPEARPEPEAPSGSKTQGQEPEAGKTEEEGPGPAGPGPTQTHLPKINFSTFILSMNSSALVQLGLIEDPATGKKEKNLPLAKQTIDILGMLDEKTKGNLTEDEQRMLRTLLYDLRIMYVREAG